MTKIIWYNELAKNNSNLEQREHAIKELSDKICSRRKEYASILEHDLVNIRMDKDQILELITNIRKSYNVLSNNKREELESKCNELEEVIENYEETSDNLCIRFRNQKIKVVAFGPKSQGKSTFTCLYTGLDESIVSVKQAGNDDKTGATSVIQHRENEELEIRVFLKSQEEILSIINSSLKALSSLNLDIPGTIGGVYKSWKDFMDIMNNHTEKSKVFKKIYSLRNTAQVKNFTSNVAVLTSVFRTENIELGIKGESDFSEVLPESKITKEIKDKGIEISKSDLPMYNDMQHTGNQRYMTVSHIKIFTDLKRQNMFENFEICDTKGLSEDAGGSAHENLIYKQLNEADAAFSIFMLKTGDMSQTFYETLANRIHSKDGTLVKPSDFASKHFAILNIAEDGFTESTPKVAHDIKGNEDVANKVYIGAFKTQSYDGKMIDAKLFADSLIFDMLETVVANTKQQDDSLINECNKLQSTVITCKNELVKILSDIQDECDNNNVEYILLEKIAELRNAAILKLEQEAKAHDIPLQCVVCGTDDDVVMNDRGDSKDDYFDDEDDDLIDTGSSPKSDRPAYQEHLTRNLIMDDPKRDIRTFEMITAESDETVIADVLRNAKKSASVSDLALEYLLEKEIKAKAGSNVYMNSAKVDGSVNSLGGYIDSVSALLFSKIEDNINANHSLPCNIDSIVDLRTKVYQVVWDALKLKGLLGELTEEVLEKHNYNYVMNKWYRWYTSSIKDQYSSIIVPQHSYNILIAYFNGLEHDMNSNLRSGSVVDWNRLKQAVQKAYKIYDFEGRILEKIANEELLRHNIFRALHTSLKNPSFDIDMKGIYLGRSADDLYKIGIISKTEHDRITNQHNWEILRNAREQLKTKSVTSLQKIK